MYHVKGSGLDVLYNAKYNMLIFIIFRFPTRLLSTPNRYLGRVSKEEIELMIAEIEITEPDVKTGTLNLLSSQALLAIRYQHQTHGNTPSHVTDNAIQITLCRAVLCSGG